MREYIALVHKDAGSDYGISFPDFPGAVTAAPTLEEARAAAEEALALHVQGMIEDGEALPERSSLDAIMADAVNRDGLGILVPLKIEPPKAVRINVTMPVDVLAAIDAHAEKEGFTRSGFLVRAAREAMATGELQARGLRDDPAQINEALQDVR